MICFILFICLSGCAEHENSEKENGKTDRQKVCYIDYGDANSFEKSLSKGAKVKGKIVRFDVVEYKPMTLQETFESFGTDNIMAFGTAENKEELNRQMSKAILCIEMENWEKAETFTEAIKHLTFNAPKEIKTTALKLKMAVQKSDYDKSIEVFNTLASHIKESIATFGTGYPFYALDENLEGEIPIIQEQVRYNRQLVKDGEGVKNSIWKCKSCLKQNYNNMRVYERL